MKQLLLAPFLLGFISPVSAEKMTEKEKTEWIEGNKQCPVRMMSKAKNDNRILAFYKMAEENNINNIDEKIIKPAFNTYCDCMKSIAFIDIHKEVFLNQKKPLELFPFEMYGHYNVKGYKLISEKIYNIIKNLNE